MCIRGGGGTFIKSCFNILKVFNFELFYTRSRFSRSPIPDAGFPDPRSSIPDPIFFCLFFVCFVSFFPILGFQETLCLCHSLFRKSVTTYSKSAPGSLCAKCDIDRASINKRHFAISSAFGKTSAQEFHPNAFCLQVTLGLLP